MIDMDTGAPEPMERLPDVPMPEAPPEVPEEKKRRKGKARKVVTPASGNDKGAQEERERARAAKSHGRARGPVWRVGLRCPTPLAHPVLEIEAPTEAAARAEFCRRNGISDSIHPWEVVRVA